MQISAGCIAIIFCIILYYTMYNYFYMTYLSTYCKVMCYPEVSFSSFYHWQLKTLSFLCVLTEMKCSYFLIIRMLQLVNKCTYNLIIRMIIWNSFFFFFSLTCSLNAIFYIVSSECSCLFSVIIFGMLFALSFMQH